MGKTPEQRPGEVRFRAVDAKRVPEVRDPVRYHLVKRLHKPQVPVASWVTSPHLRNSEIKRAVIPQVIPVYNQSSAPRGGAHVASVSWNIAG